MMQWREQQLQEKKILDSNQEVVSVVTQVGTVDLNHSN
jgi:hypothetical protein